MFNEILVGTQNNADSSVVKARGTKEGAQESGFIAQELDEAQQAFAAEAYLDLVLKGNPEKLEATPGKLLPVLVKAVQELSAQNKQLSDRLMALEAKGD